MAMLVLAVIACMARAAWSGARVSEMAMRRANNARAAAKIRHLQGPSWYDAASCQWIFVWQAMPGSLNLDRAVAALALAIASRFRDTPFACFWGTQDS